MPVSRRVLAFLAISWVVVVLYPHPGVLLASVRNLRAAHADPGAAGALAASLPDDPREIERLILSEVVPYASDWEAGGVPWSFPTAGDALAARRGDCESRALVLASVLAAKGIPHELRMSFDHIWVDYPGKVPTASENARRAIAGTDGGGWSALRWPSDVDLGRELRAQRAIYWDPMPEERRLMLLAGLLGIVCWNACVRLTAGPAPGRSSGGGTIRLSCPPRPSSAGGSS